MRICITVLSVLVLLSMAAFFFTFDKHPCPTSNQAISADRFHKQARRYQGVSGFFRRLKRKREEKKRKKKKTKTKVDDIFADMENLFNGLAALLYKAEPHSGSCCAWLCMALPLLILYCMIGTFTVT